LDKNTVQVIDQDPITFYQKMVQQLPAIIVIAPLVASLFISFTGSVADGEWISMDVLIRSAVFS
jgi:hypothetical protein